MIKHKFCIVGVDPDFDDFIFENKTKYLGLITNFNNKKYIYNNIKLGMENKKDWLKIKKKFNPKIIIAVDDGKAREKLKRIYGRNVTNLISKDASISPLSLKKINNLNGILINKLVYISSRVTFKEGVKVHVQSQIHHDVSIGKYVTLAPRCLLLGGVKVGDYSYIGAGSIIKQGIKIGSNCIVGAGSVIIKNVKNNSKIVGNPGRNI